MQNLKHLQSIGLLELDCTCKAQNGIHEKCRNYGTIALETPNCIWNEGPEIQTCSLQVPEELCGEFAFCAWPHVEQRVWTVEVQKVKLQEMDPPESRVPDRQES